MKKRISILLSAVLLVAGCGAPKVVPQITNARPALASTADVVVINLDAPDPENAEVIGTVRIGDNGFTTGKNGTYEHVIALAKDEARRAGGNAIRITSHEEPDAQSGVHRIKATILKVRDTSKVQRGKDYKSVH